MISHLINFWSETVFGMVSVFLTLLIIVFSHYQAYLGECFKHTKMLLQSTIHTCKEFIYIYMNIYLLLICYFVDSRILITIQILFYFFLFILSYLLLCSWLRDSNIKWIYLFIIVMLLSWSDPFINNLIFSLLAAICMDIGFHLLPFS